ncbi:MAG TPA: superoxide dismutase, Ni [Patescibacteria group bacterium]|nr:superoxide dismutase, Ni [Patescibacteria group bacterium]
MQKLLQILEKTTGSEIAYAHCDLPCGIYDPYSAQLAALTVIRMMDVIKDFSDHGHVDAESLQNLARAVEIKEDHAEKVKHELRVIWGDYFKSEHFEKYPQLHGLVNEILKLGSKCKQTTSREYALQMLAKVNEFTKIFWETKGIIVKEVTYPMNPKEKVWLPEF